jgi:hypothetical protein
MILREFRKLKNSCKDVADVILCYDNTKRDSVIPDDCPSHIYNTDIIKRLGYRRGEKDLWWNPEYIVLDFFSKNTQYEYYWRIEHDVRFYGSWKYFFDTFVDDDADFIGPRIEQYKDIPNDMWWKTLNFDVEEKHKVKSLFSMQRFSKRSLGLLDSKYKNGAHGFCEVLVTTLLSQAGYEIKDIGKQWYNERTFGHRECAVKGEKNKLCHPVRATTLEDIIKELVKWQKAASYIKKHHTKEYYALRRIKRKIFRQYELSNDE